MTAAGACERFVSAWRIEVDRRSPRPVGARVHPLPPLPISSSRRTATAGDTCGHGPAPDAPWRWDPRMERCDVEWRVDWGLPPGRHRLRRCRPRRSAALAALFVLVRDAVATQSLAPLVQRRMARAAGRIAMNGAADQGRRAA